MSEKRERYRRERTRAQRKIYRIYKRSVDKGSKPRR
jgi:hypothetical protein